MAALALFLLTERFYNFKYKVCLWLLRIEIVPSGAKKPRGEAVTPLVLRAESRLSARRDYGVLLDGARLCATELGAAGTTGRDTRSAKPYLPFLPLESVPVHDAAHALIDLFLLFASMCHQLLFRGGRLPEGC